VIERDTIPLVDLSAQYQSIKGEILSALSAALDGMNLFLGENVKLFEQEFAEYCGTGHCVGVGSGTDALILALRACGVGPGDEVITVANTFIATVEAIHAVGARPVLVDVDPDTCTLDPTQIEARITSNTRAIVPVHLFGRLADLTSIVDVARRHSLVVVEDACQAHGASEGGRRAGSFGDVGCFSFYFSKNLGAYGEAGAVVTDNPEIAKRVALLRNHGSPSKYQHSVLGVNSRLDELQAAVLRVKLRHLDRWNEQRRAHAATYNRLLGGLELRLPDIPNDSSHVFHLYVVRSDRRDALRVALQAEGVAIGVHYPIPVHLQPAWTAHGYETVSLPVTEALAREILSFPLYPEMTTGQIERVCACVARALASADGRDEQLDDGADLATSSGTD